MTTIFTFPDSRTQDPRIAKAVNEIVKVLGEFDPPLNTATVVGVLELCKHRYIYHQQAAIEAGY